MLNKCLAVMLILWCAAQTAWAAEVSEYLVVHLKDGSQVSYVLDDKPVVTYPGTMLHVESATLSDDHNMAQVSKITFEKKTALCERPAVDETRIIVTPEAVTIQGLPSATSVTLTDLQGRVLVSCTADDSGEATLATGNLPAGVYIVATSVGRAFKIYKK